MSINGWLDEGVDDAVDDEQSEDDDGRVRQALNDIEWHLSQPEDEKQH